MIVRPILVFLSCLYATRAIETYAFVRQGTEVPLRMQNFAGYRGSFEGVQVWYLNETAPLATQDGPQSHIVSVESHAALLHLRATVLDPEVFPHFEPASVLEEAQAVLLGGNELEQLILSQEHQPELLLLSERGAFWSLPHTGVHQALELLNALPYIEAVFVSPYDLPLPGSLDVKRDASRARLRDIIDNLSFQSIIDRLAASIQAKHLREIVRHLSAEDGKAPWKTRHSFTTGARLAAEWLKHEYEKTGASCFLHHYFTGFSPNVICSYGPPGGGSLKNDTQTPVVVIGAHYDDRGTFGFVRAPGADDDGSGSAMLLNLARTIKRFNIHFDSAEVILAAFSGEEQGLWGSRYFAKLLQDQGRDVLFMLQADMLAYRKPGEPFQVAFPDAHAIPEGAQLITNISALYTPDLRWGTTPACCSDHQSFDDLGFASSWVFERAGPIADPKYHNSGDLSSREGYDFEQLRLISSLVLALLLSITPFRL